MKTLVLSLALAAATCVGAVAPQPVQAGGNALVFQVNPSTRAEARAVRQALARLAQGSNAHVTQQGSNNGAAVTQQGRGSVAVIQQRGDGHSGSVTQRGNNHAYGLFQFGEATEHHVTQQGRRRAGMTVIIGY